MGKLIVFEGTDGSGKATQSALLCQELEKRGIAFRKLEFPRYQEESSALIRLYLGGAFGSDPDDVNAYAASAFYSVDRYASYKQDWGGFYEAGGLLIADRYTTSNAVHQTSKLPPEKRDAFLDWLFDFEYHLLGLPEPTRVLYLDMPVEATEQMMRLREEATHTKADIHEKDEAYLRRCRENAAYVVARCGWTRIDCAKDGAPRLINDIHREVMACVADLIGCEVRDADTGKVYGVVTSVDHPGAQDIYTVKSPSGKEYMFPGVDAFLKERNPPEGYILVTPIPGLLDDDFDSEREEE